jgi:hypothetical protein
VSSSAIAWPVLYVGLDTKQPSPAWLAQELELRHTSERLAATWIHFAQPGPLDRAGGVPGAERRHHRLKLRRAVRGDRAALVCEITLVGGIFAATVQLTPQAAMHRFDAIDDVEEVAAF